MENFLSGITTTATNVVGAITSTVKALFDMLVEKNAETGAITGPSIAGWFVGLGIVGGLVASGIALFNRLVRARR